MLQFSYHGGVDRMFWRRFPAANDHHARVGRRLGKHGQIAEIDKRLNAGILL